MKTEEFKRRAIRHGEVMIIPIERLPGNVEKAEAGRRVVIGHSESGHHHVAVSDNVDLTVFRPVGGDTEELYLQVQAVARVEHLKPFDKHETKALQPGLYYVNTKEQYDYFAKRQAKVVD
jgi:hypothetical protein